MNMLHMSLITVMKATIISKLDSKKIADYVMDYQPQWFAGVPAHYKRIAESEEIAKKGVSFLKAGAVGGDAMTADLYLTVNGKIIKEIQEICKEKLAEYMIPVGIEIMDELPLTKVGKIDYRVLEAAD